MDAVNEAPCAPNHHAQYPGFSGITGLIAALSMLGGRSGNAELAMQLSGACAGDTVVDIGCGPGAAARAAARAGAKVIGIDPAPVMLRVARLVRPSASIRYELGSAEALHLPEGSTGVVWSIASVHHWSDVAVALGEIRRVLQPGGRFVAIERLTRPGAIGHASHGWNQQHAAAFAEACAAHGFSDVRVERHQRARRPAISVTATCS
jgi:ubiquinone/menaquinone biosynthesis C-methylase UbiE